MMSKSSSAEVVHEQAGNLLDIARAFEKVSHEIEDPKVRQKIRDLTKDVAEASRALSGISSGIAQKRYKY